MAIHDNDRLENIGRGSKRGSVNNKSRLAGFKEHQAKGTADWCGCDPRKIQEIICAITALGGAVTFGLSRDGGAHSLTLMLDSERTSLWFNGDANLGAELDTVLGVLGSM